MRLWIGGGEVLLVLVLLLLVVGLALRRAASDWSYRVRVVRVLAMISALNSPGECPDLWEVVLVDPNLWDGSSTLAFASSDRPQDVGLLVLDRPLGELAERCEAWRATGTPLLFSGDSIGEAVLLGPDGCLAGRVRGWRVDAEAGSGEPW
jgi:hypothetical protein